MAPTDPPPIFSLTSLLSLSAVLAIVLTAYALMSTLLPKKATSSIKFLFWWHAFDAMVHFTLEASYLFSCFFHWAPAPADLKTSLLIESLPFTPPGVHFLSQPARLYGAFYGESIPAKLWQEYAKADKRWGGADLTVISLELLTVGVMAPTAVYVCYLLTKGYNAKAFFWATFIATGELYGGFMTFAPEWLSGNKNLDGSNFMYMWVYLFFMNMLWVVIPFWILYEAYNTLTGGAAGATQPKRTRARSTAPGSVRKKKA